MAPLLHEGAWAVLQEVVTKRMDPQAKVAAAAKWLEVAAAARWLDLAWVGIPHCQQRSPPYMTGARP